MKEQHVFQFSLLPLDSLEPIVDAHLRSTFLKECILNWKANETGRFGAHEITKWLLYPIIIFYKYFAHGHMLQVRAKGSVDKRDQLI